MTANQINYYKAREDKRHNEASEELTREQHQIQRESNAIAAASLAEQVRHNQVAEEQNALAIQNQYVIGQQNADANMIRSGASALDSAIRTSAMIGAGAAAGAVAGHAVQSGAAALHTGTTTTGLAGYLSAASTMASNIVGFLVPTNTLRHAANSVNSVSATGNTAF